MYMGGEPLAMSGALTVLLKCHQGCSSLIIRCLVSHLFQVPIYPPQQSLADFTPEVCKRIVRQSIGLQDIPVRLGTVRQWTMSSQVADRFQVGPSACLAQIFSSVFVSDSFFSLFSPPEMIRTSFVTRLSNAWTLVSQRFEIWKYCESISRLQA